MLGFAREDMPPAITTNPVVVHDDSVHTAVAVLDMQWLRGVGAINFVRKKMKYQ